MLADARIACPMKRTIIAIPRKMKIVPIKRRGDNKKRPAVKQTSAPTTMDAK
jgi:hypothetical protein